MQDIQILRSSVKETVSLRELQIRRDRPDSSGRANASALITLDDGGIIQHADTGCEAMLGHTPDQLVGEPVYRILASREDNPMMPANRDRLATGEPVRVTFRHREGFFFTATLSLQHSVRDTDQAAAATISVRDPSAMDPRLLHAAQADAGLGLWELDLARNELFWSDGVYHQLDIRPGTALTPEQALFYCQGSQLRLRALVRRCIRTGRPFHLDVSLLTARQTVRRARISGQRLRQDNGQSRLAGTLVDISGQAQANQALGEARALLAATGQATADLVVAVDTALTLRYCNDAYAREFQRAFGQRPRPGDALPTLLANHPNELRLIERLWHRAFERGGFVIEMPLTHQPSELPVHEFHYQTLSRDHGEVIGAVQVGRPMHHRPQHSATDGARLRHDPVTGLMNRRAFLDRLARALEQAPRRDTAVSLLYLDLDEFERFNEQAGNGTGDRYLRELAGNLSARVRQRDALARLSGDTFALLMEHCPEPKARQIADGILTLVGEFRFQWQGHSLGTTASGGLLILNPDAPADPETLLGQAADLCQTAKSSGRNRIHTAQALSEGVDDAITAQRLAQIRTALDAGSLTLEFQSLKPVASATWGDHIEILCRIPGDEGQAPLHPDQFLPVAERFDLARKLDRQVIRQTLAWLGRHRLLEPRIKYCGFNLSLASVLDDGFADFLEAELARSPYAPACMVLEIREAHATQYPDDVAVLCDALHRVGCRVALDGAGASVESYQLAARLPVDLIKLDRRMMDRLEDDPVQQVMVDALHRIAEAAGKDTVATFIESDESLRKVRALGIHFGQGFRLSRPRPLSDLTPAAVDLTTGRIGG